MSTPSQPVDKLSPERKRALLTELLRKKAREPQTAPLSFGQQRLWFLDQLEPDNPVYNESGALRLLGTLDVTALEQVFNKVVRRHEVLRTTFVVVDGEPVQVIAPSLRLTLPVVDLGDLPESERDSQVRRLVREEAEQPFNLARGPLLRIRLLRLDEQDHVLVMTLHHIICDGWSIGVLSREVAALYKAFQGGCPSPLPELPIQYADYARWQRQWLQGEALQKQLSYWKQQLGGQLPVLSLPTDRPRPESPSNRGAGQSLMLPPSLTDALKEMSRREGVTLFMTLLAGFKCLLSRYTGEDDIIVGSPIAGRTRAETEGLIGFFVNTLVLRTNLSGDPSFREVLARVREVTLSAYAHQELPFEKLVEELQPERDMTRTPIFQVMFALQNTPRPTMDLPGLRLSRFPVDGGMAKFDLVLSIMEEEDRLRGWLVYNLDLFEAATITRMLGHFRNLLEDVILHPDERLSALPLLTEHERHQILVAWNDTGTDEPQRGCLHQLFQAQAERTPDNVAVVFEDKDMTYRELNRRANQVAHHLQKLGVGPEVRVGICLERSLEMIIGLLGILKAGGVYVPLDPAYPKQRLAFMIEDSGCQFLLTRSGIRDRVRNHESRIRIVCLDVDREVIAQESDRNPVSEVMPGNLAYLIYTSGSTGKPKAVMIQHGSLVNHTESATSEYALKPGDRVLQFASISFDASAEEMYPCLTCGATLLLRSDTMLESIPVFLQKCQAWGITVLNLPTVYWHELTAKLEAEALAIPSSVRLVIIGGERALPGRLASWQKHVGQRVRLVNTYGPTEATVVATRWDVSAPSEAETGLAEVPIGRAIGNVQIYILDRSLRPVPIGVYGELHIGGAGLARGYLNRPEVTAEMFIPHPFSQEPGARLYKTGDLARYRSNGSIEFLGRRDHQVKIRGFRIEPGEIEAALENHEAVRDAVVVAREERPGDKRLVAYFLPTQEPAVTSSELGTFLKERLPEYMVPSAFVPLEALPVTPNGKLDRQALPALDGARPELEKAFVAPRTAPEEILARIWTEVLGLDRIGVHDNFFEVGGHSLLATQIVARARDAFQVELPLRTLFEKPTIEELAVAIEETLIEELEKLSEDEVQDLIADLPVRGRAQTGG